MKIHLKYIIAGLAAIVAGPIGFMTGLTLMTYATVTERPSYRAEALIQFVLTEDTARNTAVFMENQAIRAQCADVIRDTNRRVGLQDTNWYASVDHVWASPLSGSTILALFAQGSDTIIAADFANAWADVLAKSADNGAAPCTVLQHASPSYSPINPPRSSTLLIGACVGAVTAAIAAAALCLLMWHLTGSWRRLSI